MHLYKEISVFQAYDKCIINKECITPREKLITSCDLILWNLCHNSFVVHAALATESIDLCEDSIRVDHSKIVMAIEVLSHPIMYRF
jgi:hypothetical protein